MASEDGSLVAFQYKNNPLKISNTTYSSVKVKTHNFSLKLLLGLSSLALIFVVLFTRSLKNQEYSKLIEVISNNENDLRDSTQNNCPNTLLANHIQCCSDPSYPVLGGIDVVGMASDSQSHLPVWGSEENQFSLTTLHGTYKFYFQSQSNLDKFASDPWRYVPVAGGFAADIFAEQIFAAPDKLTKLDTSSDITTWMFADSHLILTSGERDYSTLELVAIEGKAVRNWAYLFRTGDSIFNTQCLKGLAEGAEQDLLENLMSTRNSEKESPNVSVVRGEKGELHIMVKGVKGNENDDVQLEMTTDKDGNFVVVMKPKKPVLDFSDAVIDHSTATIEPEVPISPQEEEVIETVEEPVPAEEEEVITPPIEISTEGLSEKEIEKAQKDAEKEAQKEAERLQKEAEKAQREAEKEVSKTEAESVPAIPFYQEGEIGMTVDGIPIAAVPLIAGVPFPQKVEFDLTKGRNINTIPQKNLVPQNAEKPKQSGGRNKVTDEIPVTGLKSVLEAYQQSQQEVTSDTDASSVNQSGSLSGALSMLDIPVAGQSEGGLPSLDIPIAGQSQADTGALSGALPFLDVPIAGQSQAPPPFSLLDIPTAGQKEQDGSIGTSLADIPVAGSRTVKQTTDNTVTEQDDGIKSLSNIPIAGLDGPASKQQEDGSLAGSLSMLDVPIANSKKLK